MKFSQIVNNLNKIMLNTKTYYDVIFFHLKEQLFMQENVLFLTVFIAPTKFLSGSNIKRTCQE